MSGRFLEYAKDSAAAYLAYLYGLKEKIATKFEVRRCEVACHSQATTTKTQPYLLGGPDEPRNSDNYNYVYEHETYGYKT